MKTVLTPEFRVSFPSVFEPSAFEDQTSKYKITMLFDKKADLSKIKELMNNAINDKWQNRPGGLRNPLRDGSEKPELDGYKDTIFCNATSKIKPGLVDVNVQAIINQEDFYAGCYARASITAYAYDKAGNKGVAFGLQNIQKIREGEPFSGRVKAEDDFKPIESTNENPGMWK
jgi:hypothetical protein